MLTLHWAAKASAHLLTARFPVMGDINCMQVAALCMPAFVKGCAIMCATWGPWKCCTSLHVRNTAEASFAKSRSCHAEFDGTAIETSITATLRLTLHKKGALPLKLSKLNFPLLENANEYVVHGFNYGVRLRIPSFLSEGHSKWKKRSAFPCPNRGPNCRSSPGSSLSCRRLP